MADFVKKCSCQTFVLLFDVTGSSGREDFTTWKLEWLRDQHDLALEMSRLPPGPPPAGQPFLPSVAPAMAAPAAPPMMAAALLMLGPVLKGLL
jgi:hypothetical protein